MTIDQIAPALLELYRHRPTGRLARLQAYDVGDRRNYVLLTFAAGGEWLGVARDFWAEFIHSAARMDGRKQEAT